MGNIIENTSHSTESGAASPAVALLLCTDLMFGVQLQNMAKHSGLKPVNVRPGSPLPDGDILVVDLGTRGDWESMVREATSRGIKVVAFGPHMDAESRTKAKAAGAARVLANSNLARDLPIILKEINHA